MKMISVNRDGQSSFGQRIEVVTTQTEGLKESGFGSQSTCQGIVEILANNYSSVRLINALSLHDLEKIVGRSPDLVVLCVKYIFDDETASVIWLSEYFGERKIPFTGSNFQTLDFDSNKSRAKTLLKNKGVRTADYFLARPGEHTSKEDIPLSFPLFVKPMNAANGNGIDEFSIVHDFKSFKNRVAFVVHHFGQTALVEQVLTGREFTVAVLESGKNNPSLVMPIEIVAPTNIMGDRILGYEVKTKNNEEIRPVKGPLRRHLIQFALAVFNALGVRDFGRIDIKLDAEGNPNFIEANLVPGMTPNTSYFPKACQIDGDMSYESVVLKMVEFSLSRRSLILAI